ncbi:MAG: hypothetical protein WCK15_25065, partial [Pirellula sp.]
RSIDMGTQLVVLVEQTSGQEGVLKRATSIMVAGMRWRPWLSIRWKRSCRRLFSAIASQRKNSIDANRASSPLGFLND